MDYELLRTLTESINDKGKFKAVFVLGIPGAGKSYTIDQITDGAIAPRIVNTDRISEHLNRTSKADISQPDYWAHVRETAIATNREQLALYVNGMLPLFIDTTSANESAVIRRKGILESLGYDTAAVWIDVDLETALTRVTDRQNQRHVSLDHVRRTYESSLRTKQFIMSRFDTTFEVDNGSEEISNETMYAVAKKVGAFFGSEIHNPLGVRIIETLRERGEKYLTDSIMDKQRISAAVNAWYVSH